MNKLLRILKLVILPLIIAVGIYSFIRFVWLVDDEKEFKFANINTEEYLNLYYDSKESVVLVFKDDTSKLNEYQEIIRDKFFGKKVLVYYYNITNLNDSELSNFASITGLGNEKKYELPMLIYTLNGQPYDILKGYKEAHYVQDFIDRNNIG